MEEKWRVASSKSLVKDRWIDLRVDSCVTASGAQIEPYYVLAYPDWVNVIALTNEDNLVLVRQYVSVRPTAPSRSLSRVRGLLIDWQIKEQ